MHKPLREIVCWARTRLRVLWSAMAPHVEPDVEVGAAVDIVRMRRDLVLENAMLRHRIVILRRKSPRPRLTALDRLGILVAAAVLPTWRRALGIVQPETVLRWHREGFRLLWRRRSSSAMQNRAYPLRRST